MFRLSISLTSFDRFLTGISQWWLWTSTKGNFDLYVGFSETTKVEVGEYSPISIKLFFLSMASIIKYDIPDKIRTIMNRDIMYERVFKKPLNVILFERDHNLGQIPL